MDVAHSVKDTLAVLVSAEAKYQRYKYAEVVADKIISENLRVLEEKLETDSTFRETQP